MSRARGGARRIHRNRTDSRVLVNRTRGYAGVVLGRPQQAVATLTSPPCRSAVSIHPCTGA